MNAKAKIKASKYLTKRGANMFKLRLNAYVNRLFGLALYVPVNNCSVMSEWVFLG